MNGSDMTGRLVTGISGFDQIALGGLPSGRTTLVTGSTGSGKTLFAVEFLARGILRAGEPGVFVTFEETPDDLRRNWASLGFPVRQWEREGKWAFVDASAGFQEAPVIGSYDFGALAARIGHAARQVSAARISVDSLDAVFTRFAGAALVRHELARIAGTLEDAGVTSVITAERAGEDGRISRYGVEEFVVDNVVVLRNVLDHERRRRTIEIVKMRGAPHRTGQWLFTIDPRDELDRMCGGGFFKDAIILLVGPSGAGKTLTSLKFLAAGLRGGERCLAFTFDENREQVRRNSAGWGIDLDSAEESGLLRIVCEYPEVASLEDHFIRIRRAIEEHQPGRLVIDTLSALERIVSPRALLDFVIALGALVRQHGITTLLTSAPAGRFTPQLTPSIAGEIASLTDVTITLRYFEQHGEIRRAIAVMQTRGSAHDPGIRQVTIDGDGMHIAGPVPGTAGIISGAAAFLTLPGTADPPASESPQPGG